MRNHLLIVLLPVVLTCSQLVGSVAIGQLERTDDKRSEQYQDAPKEDLEAIQGLWSRTYRSGLFSTSRVTKEIQGDREVVTYYTSDGKVDNANSVKIRLRRAGPIKIFTYSDWKYTAGPNAGTEREGSYEYVYKVVGDTFVEIPGVLTDQDADVSLMRWKREKNNVSKSAPTQDRVGLPKDYAEEYTVLRAIYKAEKKQIVTVYGNGRAASVTERSQLPYPYGSIIVMEKANAVADADGNAILNSEGTLRKGDVIGLHVMRREPDFGVEYGKLRTGEWEYVEYHSDGSYITAPAKSFVCAECHQKAGDARDWVFHGRFSEAP